MMVSFDVSEKLLKLKTLHNFKRHTTLAEAIVAFEKPIPPQTPTPISLWLAIRLGCGSKPLESKP